MTDVCRVRAAVTARSGRTRPSSPTAPASAVGILLSASSDTARTTAAGTPRSRAHASTAADSMSTASAPVSIQRRAFCAADSTTAATVRSAPSPGTRGSGAVGQRVPSGPSTTVGTTRAPMASDGASAPQAPATTTRSGARHAGARSARRAPRSPMVASSSAPPMKWGADAPATGARPRWRASPRASRSIAVRTRTRVTRPARSRPPSPPPGCGARPRTSCPRPCRGR